MGNQNEKIILLDSDESALKKQYGALQKDFSISVYHTFKNLIINENMKQLSKVIVRVKNKKKEVEEDGELKQKKKKKLISDLLIEEAPVSEITEMRQFQKQEKSNTNINYEDNPFHKICPLWKSEKKALWEEIINYKKTYSLNICIYLLVDDITDLAIPENEKPYIDFMTSSMEDLKKEIKKDLNQQISKNKVSIKFDRLTRNMYRRVMVKMVHPYFKEMKKENSEIMGHPDFSSFLAGLKLLKEYGVSFEKYESIQDFEKSSISTNSEYVLCPVEMIDQIVDSRKLCESSFSIIVHIKKGDEDLISETNKREIWAVCSQMQEIIEMMNRCSIIASEEKPEEATNTIVIGSQSIFILNMGEIEDRLKNQFIKDGKEEEWKKLSIEFISGRGDYFPKMEEKLNQSPYSLVIVFEEGEFLEELKGRLRRNEKNQKKCWSNRIQLTSLANFEKMSAEKTKEQQLEQYIEFKTKAFKKVKFKIRFEITPIPNIHYYIGKAMEIHNKHEVGLIKDKLGIDIKVMKRNELPDYQPPAFHNIIDSRYIICSVDHFHNVIKPELIYFHLPGSDQPHQSYLNRLKVIIFDKRQTIKEFIKDPNNYDESIVFIHDQISKVISFLASSKSPIASLPFFRKHTLSKYEEMAAKLISIKPMSLTIQIQLVSANEVLKGIFSQDFQISMNYLMDFQVFIDSEKHVRFYEQRYLEAYANLWSIGYNIFEKNKKEEYVNIQVMKEEIKHCFVICKTYDLLQINDQDFPIFYIDKINDCRTFHDLQITCLYILSLPHGLNETLSDLFRSPRKSKLAIKIFCSYVFVLLTTFCKFQDEEMSFLELVTYVTNKKDVDRISVMKQGDIVFSSSFGFCCENEEEQIKDTKNCIIYSFEKTPFLDKTKIKNHLKIEDFSFYKEGTEFLIPPFSKFKVKENKINKYGMRHLYLVQCKETADSNRESFIKMVLNANDISEKRLSKSLHEEAKKSKKNKEYLKKQYKSLHQNNQFINFHKSKEKHLESLDQGLLYFRFFRKFQEKRYISAREALNHKIEKLNTQTHQQVLELKNQQILNFLNIENALLHYKMSEYSEALLYLLKVKRYLENQVKEDERTISEKWVITKVNEFITELKEVINLRRSFISDVPKKKKWIVEPTIDSDQFAEVQFKLKGKKKLWTADYNNENQKFQLGPRTLFEPSVWYSNSEPQHELGSKVLNWDEEKLYQIRKTQQNLKQTFEKKQKFLKERVSIGKERKISKQKGIPKQQKNESGLFGLLKIQSQIKPEKVNIFEGEQEAGFEKEEWQVFYLGNDVKVASKKKSHFHVKPEQKKNRRKRGLDEQI